MRTVFMKFHQIRPIGTIRFLKPVMEKGILVLDLNLTARTTQSSRKGWRKKKPERPQAGVVSVHPNLCIKFSNR